MTVAPPMVEGPSEADVPAPPEALFKEARQRRRRRWVRAGAVVVLAAIGTDVGLRISGGGTPRDVPEARSTTSTTVRSARVALCEAPTLTPTVVSKGMATGTRWLYVALVSHASRTCRLRGRPTVTVLGRGGAPLPTTEGTVGATVTGPARSVLLARGGRASFYVTMTGRGATDAALGSCPILQGLGFTLPPSSDPDATEHAAMPSTGTPIAAYPNRPGVPCDAVGVSVLFAGLPTLFGVSSGPAASGNAGAPAGQSVH